MVKLYSTNCPKCKVLETKLKQQNIDFELVTDFNVAEMRSKGFFSAPILEVDGEFMDFNHAVTHITDM